MMDYEHINTICQPEGGPELKVCFGVDEDTGEKYFFIERDIDLEGIKELMIWSRRDSLPKTVLQGLTGKARVWTHRPGWALEYVKEGDDEPTYFEL